MNVLKKQISFFSYEPIPIIEYTSEETDTW